MGNCNNWYTVDFGRGPVEVRCTQTGTHAQCRTEVFHIPSDTAMRHNVFDD